MPDEDFGMWGSKKRRTCKACEEKDKASPSGHSASAPQPSESDFGKMYAAVKQAGEREGAKKVAQDIIDFLTRKYVENA